MNKILRSQNCINKKLIINNKSYKSHLQLLNKFSQITEQAQVIGLSKGFI